MIYAVINEGRVENIIDILPENAWEFPQAVELGDRGVIIGDSYENGSFTRNGEKVLTELERLSLELADARAALELIYSGETEEAE